ncbi:hypothetical protein D9758_015648 [Tetrapyrgos nigripes]|uniref:Uncharacterized protein n=1 Tax=Tetrapyrgos nigripes TaxID=182062 RepID=A0A8H5FNY6_9AGAR|nr:hypothetical protein D9758_015648 [Tetrapyrgos nigripes]
MYVGTRFRQTRRLSTTAINPFIEMSCSTCHLASTASNLKSRKRTTHYPIPKCHPPGTIQVFGFPLSERYIEKLEQKLYPIPEEGNDDEMDEAISNSCGVLRIHWLELCEKACPQWPFELVTATYHNDSSPFICLADNTHSDRMTIPPKDVLESLKQALRADGCKGKLGWYPLYDW